MESSKFIQLSNSILVEYVYIDRTNPGPNTFNTGSFPIEIMQDGYTDGSYFFNDDTVSATMGNQRDISAVPINKDKSQYVYLDTSIGVPYNDFDPEFTPSSQLGQVFSPNIGVEYDRIRVHFIAGFSFDGFDGVIFDVTTQGRNGNDVVLSSINFLKTDTPVFNPDPLLIADKLY